MYHTCNVPNSQDGIPKGVEGGKYVHMLSEIICSALEKSQESIFQYFHKKNVDSRGQVQLAVSTVATAGIQCNGLCMLLGGGPTLGCERPATAGSHWRR